MKGIGQAARLKGSGELGNILAVMDNSEKLREVYLELETRRDEARAATLEAHQAIREQKQQEEDLKRREAAFAEKLAAFSAREAALEVTAAEVATQQQQLAHQQAAFTADAAAKQQQLETDLAALQAQKSSNTRRAKELDRQSGNLAERERQVSAREIYVAKVSGEIARLVEGL